ncbi:MAG: hypothetical protein U0516_04455 [Candidatus Saccharibacteria bacterium]
MKRLVVLLLAVILVYPAAAVAQTSDNCSSIEQLEGEMDKVTGESSPANVLMRMIDENSFEFVVNANPGNTINFIQLVYVSNGVTYIVMPDTNIDFTLHWQTSVVGDFHYYKVNGCKLKPITSSTSTSIIASTSSTTTTTTSAIRTSNTIAPTAVIVQPAFTG